MNDRALGCLQKACNVLIGVMLISDVPPPLFCTISTDFGAKEDTIVIIAKAMMALRNPMIKTGD